MRFEDEARLVCDKKSPRGPFFSGCAGFAMARVTGSCGYFAEALSLSAP